MGAARWTPRPGPRRGLPKSKPWVDVLTRAAGFGMAVLVFGQAGGGAVAKTSNLDVATASIICSGIAGVVAVAVALIGRPRDHDPVDRELLELALQVALIGLHATAEGDDDLMAESALLAKHLAPQVRTRKSAAARGKK